MGPLVPYQRALLLPLSRQAAEPKPEAAPFHDEDTLKRNRKTAETTQKLCRSDWWSQLICRGDDCRPFPRYTSKLEEVVNMHITGALPEDPYPWAYRARSRGDDAGGVVASTLSADTLASQGLRIARGGDVDPIMAQVTAREQALGQEDLLDLTCAAWLRAGARGTRGGRGCWGHRSGYGPWSAASAPQSIAICGRWGFRRRRRRCIDPRSGCGGLC